MMHQAYCQLLRYKRWADRGLYDVVASCIDGLSQQDASILLRILDHIHVVDKVFQHHLQGVPHPYKAPRSDSAPALSALARGAMDVDDWYVSYVDGLEEGRVDERVDFTFTNGSAAAMTRGEIILHVCMHGIYHRGNAGLVLQQNRIAPKDDRLTDFLDVQRAQPDLLSSREHATVRSSN